MNNERNPEDNPTVLSGEAGRALGGVPHVDGKPVTFDEKTSRWADDQHQQGIVGQAIAEAKQREMSQTKVRFDFSMALQWLKQGYQVQRTGWNGKGMHIVLTRSGSTIVKTKNQIMFDKRVPLDPFIMMYTVQETYVPWLASQTDILAEDWQVV